MSKIIFFSWQSDIPENKQYLAKILEEFTENNPDYLLEAADRNGDDEDDIAKIIFEKLDRSDYILSDVTLINTQTERAGSERLTSNPNVLYELGYASAKKDIKKIRVANKVYVKKTGDLPFDIRNRKTILRSFTPKNRKNVYRAIEAAINSKVNVPSTVIKDVLTDVIQCKVRVDNPKVALDVSDKDTIARALSYHLDFVPKKLPKLRRDFSKYPKVVKLIAQYIDDIKNFSDIYASLGTKSHNEQLQALSKIDETLNELIDYIRLEKLATKRKLTARADFIENLDREVSMLRLASNLSLKAFYLYAEAVQIYYDQLVWMDYEDLELKAIAGDLQLLQAKYIEGHKVESVLEGLAAKVDALQMI